MGIESVFAFLGGLGLFIYGMHIMAEGLQKAAGSKMRRLLEVLTTNKFLGVLVGALVTGVIQSSSATTVMVVGFVNAGLMNLSQSVGVIMGANIGTTVTSWIVASGEWSAFLNPTTIAPVAIAVGVFMILFSKREKIKQTGQIIAGFGILFLGMSQMTVAVSPLKDSEVFRQMFLSLGSNPFLGILAGAAVTGIIQSSSASVGILQSLAAASLVPFNAAVYIIMGQNIGTCVTAIISSIGASKNAKSAAYIHLLFNVIGAVIFSAVAIVYFQFINAGHGRSLVSQTDIGVIHTSFNVANTLLLYPFSQVLISLALRMTAGIPDDEESVTPVYLDDRILETPTFALENCIKEIIRMANMSLKSLKQCKEALFEKNTKKVEKILKREKAIDHLDRAITSYLVKISKENVTREEYNVLGSLFHTTNDIERVGDHCENMAELINMMFTDGIDFSKQALDEMEEIFDIVISCFENSIYAFEHGSAWHVEAVGKGEAKVDELKKASRISHLHRLSNEECSYAAGVLFLDLVANLERISDHAFNITRAVTYK